MAEGGLHEVGAMGGAVIVGGEGGFGVGRGRQKGRERSGGDGDAFFLSTLLPIL